ncbi:uncharacterized protein VP01_773g14 [Puccinia sorghi]|uniref:Endoplasmic reticulum transmembrane protein n=1 Tax=Puccinia sorghi TaxID=27349 RepID=A0A0L6UBF0_9BASI|nr:uncharacterized protein VP01_773g14 [Puccinia sorghi]
MVFSLLIIEIVTFVILVGSLSIFLQMPLPFTWRRVLFRFLATSPLVAKLQYALSFFFFFFFFLDVMMIGSMKTYSYRFSGPGEAAREQGAGVGRDLRSETDWRSRKFLSERDMYMRGFTLFLSLILSRTFALILDLIKAQEDLATLKKQVSCWAISRPGIIGRGGEEVQAANCGSPRRTGCEQFPPLLVMLLIELVAAANKDKLIVCKT